MTRTDIINFYIRKYNLKKYLEIGVENGINFKQIDCEFKIGVDPKIDSKATHVMTSDKFFEKFNHYMFDLIFIDGLHLHEQVYVDYINSRNHLSDNGIIIFHDCLPLTEDAQTREYYTGKIWNGDVWKAWIKIRSECSDREMFIIDTDHGCGIVKNGKNEKISIDEELTWDSFCSKYKNLMNVISVDDWKKIEGI